MERDFRPCLRTRVLELLGDGCCPESGAEPHNTGMADSRKRSFRAGVWSTSTSHGRCSRTTRSVDRVYSERVNCDEQHYRRYEHRGPRHWSLFRSTGSHYGSGTSRWTPLLGLLCTPLWCCDRSNQRSASAAECTRNSRPLRSSTDS